MRSTKSLALFLAVVLAVAVLAVGCGSATTTTKAPATTLTTSAPATTATTAGTTTTAAATVVSVKIGASGPFTGGLSKIGIDALNAIKMAVDEFNAANPNIKVSVEVGDDVADPAKSSAVSEKFVSDTAVMAVVSPTTSACVQAALPVLEKGGLSMIAAAATNNDLGLQGFKVFHRTAALDSAQSNTIAGLIATDLKAKKVYILDDKGTFGQGLADQVQKTLKEQYKFTDDQIARAQITPDDKDFSAIITKVKAFGPDVFLGSIQSAAQYAAIAKQMAQQNYKVQLIGADQVKDQTEFIDNAGGATEGAYFTSLGPILETSTNPKAVEFVKKFTAKYQVLSMFSGQSYEAANVALDAFKRAYDKTGGKITRQSVTDALATTKYDGVLGFTIEFQPNGDLKEGGVFIGQVKGGQFVQVR